MAADPKQIVLTDEQKQRLAELAERIGRPWDEVFSEAIRAYRPSVTNGEGLGEESLYDALVRDGLIGCITDGPSDMSTDPRYMAGFGEHDGRALLPVANEGAKGWGVTW